MSKSKTSLYLGKKLQGMNDIKIDDFVNEKEQLKSKLEKISARVYEHRRLDNHSSMTYLDPGSALTVKETRVPFSVVERNQQQVT